MATAVPSSPPSPPPRQRAPECRRDSPRRRRRDSKVHAAHLPAASRRIVRGEVHAATGDERSRAHVFKNTVSP